MINRKKRSIQNGLLAGVGLLGLYAATMTILSGWQATVEQFASLWYLMLPLAAGFGIQVGLYTRLKTAMRQRAHTAVATSGATSGAAMIACCAHHATDVLPFLGLSGASLFLTRYQSPILIGSIGINGVGIVVMLKYLKKMNA